MSKQIKIAIASGKGGTGKTTFAVNLFHSISGSETVNLVDCDVEEPNSSLFFKKQLIETNEVNIKIPKIDKNKCEYCGRCLDYCAFNAIIYIKDLSFLKIMDDLCHGCGGCSIGCKKNAITEKDKLLGIVNIYAITPSKKIIEGALEIGVATPVPVIKAAKKQAEDSAIIIYDAPPGTSCPAVETVFEADYVILVAEPTPFGLNDLKLSVEAFTKMDKKMGVVINKAGIGNDDIYTYLNENKIDILAEIPFKKGIAEKISDGKLLIDEFEEYQTLFENTLNKIKTQIA